MGTWLARLLLLVAALLGAPSLAASEAQGAINRHPRWARFTPENSGLADLRVLDALEAADGSMWFVHPNAVSRFDARAWQTFPADVALPAEVSADVVEPPAPPWDAFDLEPATVHRAVEDSRGAVWLATSAGAFRLDPDRWENGIPAFRGMALYQVRDVLRDSYGVLWFAGYDPVSGEGSLSGLDPSGRWLFFNAEIEPLASNQVVALAEDAEGGLWAGTVSSGVSRFLGDTWQSWTAANSPLPDDRIVDLRPVESGWAMAVVTRGGVAQYDIDADAWETLPDDAAAAYRSVARRDPLSQEETLWTIDDGALMYRSPGEGRWVEAPFPFRDARHVAVDAGGMLWVQTAEGLVRYGPETGEAALFTAENSGLAESQAHLAHIDRDGLLVFATDRIYVSTYQPHPPARPSLTVSVDGGSPRPALAGSTIMLSAGAQRVTVEIGTAAWWPTDALHYRVRLEGPSAAIGESRRAHDAAAHRAQIPVNLPAPGAYTFCASVVDAMLDASPPACARFVVP